MALLYPAPMNRLLKYTAAVLLGLLPAPLIAQTQTFTSPDILVLGDSQIMFGAGPAYLEFFDDLVENCPADVADADLLYDLDVYSTAVIGVRSTSIHNWTAVDTKTKADLCEVDPNFDRNAGAYGTINLERKKYLQVGQSPDLAFCRADTSPLQTALRPDYYAPKLLVLSFLGNATKRWAETPHKADQDVMTLMSQLPQNVPCVFLTTAPSFKQSVNETRAPAQNAIATAFARHGKHCKFVRGATPQTIARLQADKHNFRIDDQGKVKDPFHPTYRGASVFLDTIKPKLCAAVISSLKETSR